MLNTLKMCSYSLEDFKFFSCLDENCGGHFYDEGFILSPNYPDKYRENLYCVWTVLTFAEVVEITIENYEVKTTYVS